MTVTRGLGLGLIALGLASQAGCGRGGEKTAKADTAAPAIISVGKVEMRPLVRTVDMVGTLKGWEDVTVGTKRTGRVTKILHDMGDRVTPGEPLVELDPIDAKLAIQQAESKYLAELVKLGLTREQAESFYKEYGVGERILSSDEVTKIILKVPAIKQAKAQLDKATNDANRQRQLFQRNSGSLQEVQDLDNARDVASAIYDNAIITARNVIAMAVSNRVALNQAEQMLADMVVRVPQPTTLPKDGSSPAGTSYAMTKRSAAEGQMVREGDALAQLVIEDPLRLWGNVPERYSADVKVGQVVEIQVPAYESKLFKGEVTRINPSVAPVSRTFQVEVRIPNTEGALRPGGFAKASIVTRRDENALMVPRDAVEKFAGVTKVFIVADPSADRLTVQAVPVQIGIEEAQTVEVQGSLKAGDVVAVTNLAQLAEGASVRIRSAAPEGEATKARRPEGKEEKADVEKHARTDVKL